MSLSSQTGLVIDASSGGQVFRTAIGLSALTGRPVVIENIRKNRPKPGLQLQHLTALHTVAQLCTAKLEGATLGSLRVVFSPGPISNARLVANIGSAGSIPLLFQSALLPLMTCRGHLRVTGGTNVPFAPPFEFLERELFLALKSMGVKCDATLSARGYYPKGKGAVSFTTQPASFPLKPFNRIERGKLEGIVCISHCASLPADVAKRQVVSAKQALAELDVDFESVVLAKETALSKGSGISLFAMHSTGAVLSASALGEKGKLAQQVGEEAAVRLKQTLRLRGAVDSFLADQLIPFTALARGKSRFFVTNLDAHVFSNIAVCEQLLGASFSVTGRVNESGEIFVQGASFVPQEVIA